MDGFIEYLKEFGSIYIRTQDINPFQEEPNIKKIKEKYIQSFTFIANWAYSVINESSIFEFDASFKAVSPYVYSIPLVIINNESIPIGFTIGVSENSILYQTFWDFLKESVCVIDYNNICALSDNHSCLQKFFVDNNIRNYLCFRHFQENFGTNSILGILVNNLLFSYSLDEFEIELNYIVSIISNYLKRNNIEQSHLRRFADYTGVYFKKINDNTVEIERVNNNLFPKLSLWSREGVPTCTNHIESLHSKVNSRVHGMHGLLPGMKAIFDSIINRIEILPLKNGRNFHNQLKTIKEKALFNETYETEKCQCMEKFVLSCRYGVDFPCHHEYFYRKNNNLIPSPQPLPNIIKDGKKGIFIENIESIQGPINNFKNPLPPQEVISSQLTFKQQSAINFFNICKSACLHHNLKMQISIAYCNHLLLNNLKMNVNDLDIAENNTKFFLSMWCDEEIITNYRP